MERGKERVAQTHAAYADYLAVETVRRPQSAYNHAIELDLDSPTPVRRPHQSDWSPTIENESFDRLGNLSSLPSTSNTGSPNVQHRTQAERLLIQTSPLTSEACYL
jgi:hypothetical protein